MADGKGGRVCASCVQYNTYSTHYKETDCLREMVEPFMYNVGVDIVLHGIIHTCVMRARHSRASLGRAVCTCWDHTLLVLDQCMAMAAAMGLVLHMAGQTSLDWDVLSAGHVHAYERTFQTVNYTLDGCAPRWLTMGGLPFLSLACLVTAHACLLHHPSNSLPHTPAAVSQAMEATSRASTGSLRPPTALARSATLLLFAPAQM